MKTKLLFLFVPLAAAGLRAASEPAAAPCCPPDPAKPACCADAAPAIAQTPAAPCCEELKSVAPLSARSLFQLDARWTDDSGREVTLAAWRGRPVLLAMMFASCEYACPVLVDDLKRLRAALPEDVRVRTQVILVSFDVVRDTPPALTAFRERQNLDANWTLLHGAEAPVQELAMLLGVKFKQDARGQFAHSNLITVLNPEGEIAHQHAGLMGDMSPAAKMVASVAR